MPQPSISVVIPSRNRLERLPDVVTRYVEQGADQIVVVLDGPHPDWRSRLVAIRHLPRVEIHELPDNLGLALARTAGLDRATGDVVVMADDDVRPEPGHIDHHRAFHAATPDTALLGYMPVLLPPVRGRDQAPTYIYARDYENQVAEWKSAQSRVLLHSFWGGNASLPASLYRRAEQFKPSQRLNYNEDLDLGLRLLAIGADARFDEGAKGYHLHSRTLESFLRECVVRGEAVRDLEARWEGDLPEQLTSLVRIPEGHGRIAARLQAAVGARDEPGLVERALRLAYRAAGALRVWPAQDAVARFLRRGLAIRGYRLAGATVE